MVPTSLNSLYFYWFNICFTVKVSLSDLETVLSKIVDVAVFSIFLLDILYWLLDWTPTKPQVFLLILLSDDFIWHPFIVYLGVSSNIYDQCKLSFDLVVLLLSLNFSCLKLEVPVSKNIICFTTNSFQDFLLDHGNWSLKIMWLMFQHVSSCAAFFVYTPLWYRIYNPKMELP